MPEESHWHGARLREEAGRSCGGARGEGNRRLCQKPQPLIIVQSSKGLVFSKLVRRLDMPSTPASAGLHPDCLIGCRQRAVGKAALNVDALAGATVTAR